MFVSRLFLVGERWAFTVIILAAHPPPSVCVCVRTCPVLSSEKTNFHETLRKSYASVSQTVVRGLQVVLGFCPCGPFRLNISPKKTEKNKINVNCVPHTIVENLKQSLEITYNKRLQTYYPTYSTLSNKRGIFCCKNMFRTLFRAGLMSLIIPRVGWSIEHSD